MVVDDQNVNLGLWDTSGTEDYDRLRPLSYAQTDVFVVCFEINNRATFLNVKNKWIPELRTHAVGVPIILIGSKLETRIPSVSIDANSTDQQFVSRAEGEALKNELKLVKYLECSARTQEGLKAVFDCAVRVVLYKNLVIKGASGCFGSAEVFET